MAIEVRCDKCGSAVHYDDALAGSVVACAICGHARHLPTRAADSTAAVRTRIHRHGERKVPFEPVGWDSPSLDRITRHIEEHLESAPDVFHELVSDLVHLDIHFARPSPNRQWHTLVTSGMSARPMSVPEGSNKLRYAELMINLPLEWPLSDEAMKDDRNYWPIRWLKTVARLPHTHKTWVGPGHTLANGDPPKRFAPNTKLCGCVLVCPLSVPDAFRTLKIDDRKTINFFGVVPLYKEEMEFAIKHGFRALLERMLEADISEVVDIRRKNVCRKARWPFWGP